MSRTTKAARSYQTLGYAVLPCRSDKSPAAPHGLKDASRDPGHLDLLWNGAPNVGILPPAGVLVLDVDDVEQIRVLETSYEALKAASAASTPRGGRHYYLRLPKGVTGLRARARALPGVDIRGLNKAYVLAPPSKTVDGSYTWLRKLLPPEELLEVPGALLSKLQPPKKSPPLPRTEWTGGKAEPWAEAALESELEAVRAAATGSRNQTLNAAAYSLGQIVGGGHLEESRVVDELLAAARMAGLGESEARKTIASGVQAGKREPRHPRSHAGGVKERPSNILPLESVGAGQPAPPDFGIVTTPSGYAVKRRGRLEHLTNWTFTPTLRLRYPGGTLGERGRLTVGGRERHTVELPSEAWNSRKDLLALVGAHGAVNFSTSNADVAKIRQIVLWQAAQLPVAKGVKTYGLLETGTGRVTLFENGALCDTPEPPVFFAGTPVDPGSRAHALPRVGTEGQVEQARQAMITLPHLVTSHAALAMTGFAVASAYAPRITRHLGHRLPFLFIAGEREGGKTSAAQILLQLVTGDDSARLLKASGLTPYQYDLAVSNTNNLLTVIDEYKPGLVDDAQLRKHHDLAVKWRGSGIAAKDHSYHLNAPTILMGEDFTEDAAALSRGVLYYVEKRHRGKAGLYAKTIHAPLWAYAHHLHQQARTLADATHCRRFERAENLAREAGNQAESPRLQYALTFIAYGLLVLQDELPTAEILTDAAIERVLEVGVEQTLDGGIETMTNLEAFLEQLGSVTLEHRDPLALMVPGTIDGQVIIRISPSVEAVKKVYRTEAAISNPRLLRQYAGGTPWADASVVHKAIGNEPVRGIRIVLSEVPERCDVSALAYLNRKLRRGHV
jgi:hypothetical protein